MRIKEITSQTRRDFTAIFECEHCGCSYSASGYDDAHFHNTVVPGIPCPACNKTAPSAVRNARYICAIPSMGVARKVCASWAALCFIRGPSQELKEEPTS